MALRSQLSGAAKRKLYGYSQPSGAANRRQYGYKPNRASERNRRFWRQKQEFLFVDGETVDDRYILLACSDKSSVESRSGLTTRQCLEYLTTRTVHTLWGFAFDYDVNMLLVDLTPSALERLRISGVTLYGDYRIEHIPGKMFRVSQLEGEPEIGHKRKSDGEHYVTIWDAFNYIHSSFARWLEDWHIGSARDQAFIRSMKDQRPNFTIRQLTQIRRYCFTELRLGAQGVEQLLERVKQVGYRPATWHSPASIAAAAMRQHDLKEHKGKLRPAVERAAELAYFGGRFEARMLGSIKGPLWHYDINSAYPAALVNLPCLACGTWRRPRPGKRSDLDLPHALLYVHWRARSPIRGIRKRQPWGPFPVRVEYGSMRYPLIGEGWYWSFEVKAALPLATIQVERTLEYSTRCEHRPFAYLGELYKKRQEMKAANDDAEYVVKLILNSTYGKLAQHPRRGREPAFRNIAWAGMITARCRTQILGAIRLDPKAIVQIATDGFTSLRRLELPISLDLGAWSEKQIHHLLLMQSGIYFWQDTRNVPFQRSRGFHPATLTQQVCYRAWKLGHGVIRLRNRRFVGYRSALARNALDEWRTWREYEIELGLTPEPRRLTVRRENGVLISAPPDRAKAELLDVLEHNYGLGWEALEEIEQPDGPEGDIL